MNALSFKGCNFTNNGIGISVPKGAIIKAEDTAFINNGTAVEVRDDIPPEISALFAEGVNKKKLLELLDTVRRSDNPSHDFVVRRIRKMGLSKWIANGANVVTVGTAIAQIISKLSG